VSILIGDDAAYFGFISFHVGFISSDDDFISFHFDFISSGEVFISSRVGVISNRGDDVACAYEMPPIYQGLPAIGRSRNG